MNLLTKTVLIVAVSLCLMLLVLHDISERVLLSQHEALEDAGAARSLDQVWVRLEEKREALCREQVMVVALLSEEPFDPARVQSGLRSCLIGLRRDKQLKWLLQRDVDPSLVAAASRVIEKWQLSATRQECRLLESAGQWYMLAGLQMGGGQSLVMAMGLNPTDISAGDKRLTIEIAPWDGALSPSGIQRQAGGGAAGPPGACRVW